MTDTFTPLDEFLAEGVEIPNEEDAPEGWHLDNDHDANKLLRRVAAIDAEKKRLKDDADEEIRLVTSWLTTATGTLDTKRSELVGALIDYHRRLREDGKAGKTYKLPSGALKATKEQDAVLLPADEDEVFALVTWCLDNDRHGLLNISPSKSAIKKAVLDDGEKIPGVEPVKAEDDIDTNRYSVVTS